MRLVLAFAGAMLAALTALAGCAPAADIFSSCPGPRAGWATLRDGIPHHAIVNRISLSRGRVVRWNGVVVSRERLRQYLGLVGRMAPLPFTILDPGPYADCPFLQAIRDDMAGPLPCAAGACGEGRGRWRDGAIVLREPDSEEGRAALREMERAADAAANAATGPER